MRFIMALFAILQLVCGTDVIDLLNTRSGAIVRSWRPAVADAKGGGSWQDSPLASGRRLVQAVRSNIVDTITFDVRDLDQDDVIHDMQDLRRWLQKAEDYWTGGDPSVQADVPYIKARGSEETNTRYSLVHRGACLADDEAYAQPFYGIHCNSTMTALTLALEHGDWLAEAPGTSTCVQASGTGLAQGAVTVTATPAQSEDDAWIHTEDTALNLTSVIMPLGYDTETSCISGIRFPSLAVPQGAAILDAYITFRADADNAQTDCTVNVTVEESDNAAIFSTYTNFTLRYHTIPFNAPVLGWPNRAGASIEEWKVGLDYTTRNDCPLLRQQVQAIVDRPGWASGNAIAFFFADAGSTPGAYRRAVAWDHAGDDPAPILTVVYQSPTVTYGRAATCLDEVYVANKHNVAQLTNVLVHDTTAATYTEILQPASFPVDMLPAPPVDGDAIYFGVDTTIASLSGPFSSLVFDIETTAVYGGVATITWEYWNGAWVALTVRDNTGTTGFNQPFTRTGVNSVHWLQPSDWVVTAVNAITGYWVRALVALPGGGDSVTAPTQGNRDIYTVTWPYVEIDEAQVAGDLPALARLYRTNEAGLVYKSPYLFYDRVMAGLRSCSRGLRFTPYINLSDEQNDVGLAVAVGPDAAFAADTTTATGRNITYTSPGASGSNAEVAISFADDLMPEYNGTYHVFLRAEQETATTVGQVKVRLAYGFPGGRIVYTPYQSFAYVGARQVLDFGRVTIPYAQIAPGEASGGNFIYIYVSYSAAGVSIYFDDLILFPVDEWAGTFDSGRTTRYVNASVGNFGVGRYLDIDSISNPRTFLRAMLYNTGLGIIYNYRCIANGPAVLQANRDQRLWFFTTRHYSISTAQTQSDCEEAGRVRVYKLQRYFASRGKG